MAQTLLTAEDLLEEISKMRVRAARGQNKPRLSLRDISKLTQIPRSSLSNYLNGTTVMSVDNLELLLNALGASPSDMQHWVAVWETALDSRYRRSQAEGAH